MDIIICKYKSVKLAEFNVIYYAVSVLTSSCGKDAVVLIMTVMVYTIYSLICCTSLSLPASCWKKFHRKLVICSEGTRKK